MIQGLGYLDATLNITTDVIFAVLIPVPLLYHLNVSTRRRVYLIIVLGLGVLACVACIIKTVHLYQMAKYDDFLWDSRYVTIWAVAELNTGIVAGSIPAVKALFWHTTCGQNGQNKITPLTLTTFGSHRRSWRIPASAQRSSLVAAWDVSGSQSPSNVVVEDSHLYELVETGDDGGSGSSDGTRPPGDAKSGSTAVFAKGDAREII